MRLWPTKTQWKRWTLPSRHTTLGLMVAIIGIIVALLLWGINYSLSRKSADKYKKAEEYLSAAKNNEKDGNYSRMLKNALKAYEFRKSDEEIVYYLAYSYYRQAEEAFYIKARDVLIDNKHKLTARGLSLLAVLKAHFGYHKEAVEIFDSIDLHGIPLQIRLVALDGYVVSSAFVSQEKKNKLGQVCQRVKNYIDNEIIRNSSSTMEIIFHGDAKNVELMRFDLNTLAYLPAIKFRIGCLLLNQNLKEIDIPGISISIKCANAGIASALLYYQPDLVYAYLDLFKEAICLDKWATSNKGAAIESLKRYIKILELASQDSVRIGGIHLKKRFDGKTKTLFKERSRELTKILENLGLKTKTETTTS